MIRKPLFLLVGLVFFYCRCFAQDTTYYDAKWNKTSRSNSFYTSVVKKQGSGWLRTDYFTKTGRLQMKGTLSSVNPEIRNGYFEWYFENGRLEHKGSYVNGKENGQHLWYFENGNFDAKENYVNGKHEGAYEEYYPNGKLKDKSSFVGGLQSGWTVYYREDGSIQSEGNFKNDMRDGIWKYYDEKGALLGMDTIKTEYTLDKANLYLQLPNDEWHLAVNEAPDHYIFKRDPVADSQGRSIIPAIMIYVGDAKSYHQDIISFADTNSKPLIARGVTIDETLKSGDKGYPLSYKNGEFIRAGYVQNDVPHIIFMIYIINKQDTGIQVYLDMTKDIAAKYEPEFWTTINSLKEVN